MIAETTNEDAVAVRLVETARFCKKTTCNCQAVNDIPFPAV